MTGKDISASVNRAFRIIGGLFLFGGIYLGTLMYISAPVVIETSGEITSVKREKQRPLGFESIPVDSTDPAHENIPLYTNVFATVEYLYEGEANGGDIVSWSEDTGWEEGKVIPLYLIEGEEDIPLDYYPAEAGKEKSSALIISIAMSVMGGVFLFLGFWSEKREFKADRELLIQVKKLKSQNWQSPVQTFNRSIMDETFKGNFLLGGILSCLGLILMISLIPQLFLKTEIISKLMTVFPVLLGLAIFYMGSCELFRDKVTVTDREVRIRHSSLWKRFDRKQALSSFVGIKENILEQNSEVSIKRQIYREQVLLHHDPYFNNISIKLIPDNKEANAEAKKLSKLLNLPRILQDGESIVLDYPGKDKNIRQETFKDEPWDPAIPFPAKTLKLKAVGDGELLVVRSYLKSLVWGMGILAAGTALAFFSGEWTVMIPVVVIGMIFTLIAFKKDILTVKDGVLSSEKIYMRRTYSSESLKLKDIEEILSGNDPRMYNAGSLEILSPRLRIYFGQAATDAELVWLKGWLRTLIKE